MAERIPAGLTQLHLDFRDFIGPEPVGHAVSVYLMWPPTLPRGHKRWGNASKELVPLPAWIPHAAALQSALRGNATFSESDVQNLFALLDSDGNVRDGPDGGASVVLARDGVTVSCMTILSCNYFGSPRDTT